MIIVRLYPHAMNPCDRYEPVFPLMGKSPAARLMRAPRLDLLLRPALSFGERIFPGAWSVQHAPATGSHSHRWTGLTPSRWDPCAAHSPAMPSFVLTSPQDSQIAAGR